MKMMNYIGITAATAVSCKRVKMLVMRMNHLGTRNWPRSVMKLLRMICLERLPNAQYPDVATLKKVTMTTE